MTSESIVSLFPVDGGNSINIPSEKTVIGRGSFLQITDKRVSRNHATLEIQNKKLVIVPIHTNPCFYKANGIGTPVILAKDKSRVLDHGDVISLLPDKLLFKIVYLNNNDENKKDIKETEVDLKQISVKDLKNKKESDPDARPLPVWMVGASSRIGRNGVQKTKVEKIYAEKDISQSKATPVTLKKSKKSEDEEEEIIDEDDDEDWKEEVAIKQKQKRSHASSTNKHVNHNKHSSKSSRSNKPSTRRKARDMDEFDDDDDDEASHRKRRPRAAAQNKPKYTDDDFVMSDEEIVFDNEDEPINDADSDFVADDAESGSDWENRKTNKNNRSRKGLLSSHKKKRSRLSDSEEEEELSESEDDYRPKSGGRKYKRTAVAGSSVGRKHRKKNYSDEEEDDVGSDKDYGSKRGKKKTPLRNQKKSSSHGQNKSHKRKIDLSEQEEDEEGEETGAGDERDIQPTAQNKNATKDVTKISKKRKLAADDSEEEDISQNGEIDESESVDDGDIKLKIKKPCQYGNECFRKNAKHLEEFSHPAKLKEQNGNKEIEENNTPPVRQKRAAALKQKEKLEVMHNNEIDDELEDLEMAESLKD